tara:strand:+ start:2318 stop:3406 length:1089 start_codon:yes stop_codon:yes gene_type:complete
MSRGTKLQEMEQSKTAVNANAVPGDQALEKVKPITPGQGASYEDLGGPTPENYSPTNDSAKISEPKIKTVHDVVNKNAKSGSLPKDLKSGDEVEVEDSQEVMAEEPTETPEEVVSEQETIEVNIEDDVNALLGGEELSEEFREKAKVVFEAALNSKVAQIQETLEAEQQEKISEAKAEMRTSLTERVDSYLEYVSEEWMTENQLAIEHGLKTEMTESFLGGMRSLFEEHYVSIPEEKYDVLESMVEKLDDMETKLNEQIEKNVGLNKRLAESEADGILSQVSEGLASTQKEKLATLAESVEFGSDEEYREKLETLKESYFPKAAPTAKSSSPQTLSEGVDSTPEPISGTMDRYLKTMGAFSK